MRPILIGGVGRSGTSILKATLANHSEVMNLNNELRWMADPGGLFHFLSQLRYCSSPPVLDKAWKEFRTVLTDPETQSKYLGMYGEEFGYDMIYKLSVALFDVFEGSTYHFMQDRENFHEIFQGHRLSGAARWAVVQWVDELMEHRREMLGIPRASAWIDDTPENVWWFDEAKILWKDAILIHATRHPYDILASIKARMTNNPSPWWWPVEVEHIAQRIHNLCRVSASRNAFFFHVQMEDVIRAPKTTLGPILYGMGLDWEAEMDRFIQPNIAHIGRWEEELTAHDLAVIQPILEPVIRGWGYADN